jgi:large subunit ribosomal protein L18
MLSKKRQTRKTRIRGKVSGTKESPRLSIYRSNKQIYAQLINDEKHETLASAKGTDPRAVGEEIAKSAKKAKIKSIVFDRSGYKYHGKVKALADAAREGGLEF